MQKMYGTHNQWVILRHWLKKNHPEYLTFMYGKPKEKTGDFPVANFPQDADFYLFQKCPIEFVRKNLREKYPGWATREKLLGSKSNPFLRETRECYIREEQ